MNDKNTVIGKTQNKMQKTTFLLLQEFIILCTLLHCSAQNPKPQKNSRSP